MTQSAAAYAHPVAPAGQHSTAQHTTAQHSAANHSMTEHSQAHFSTAVADGDDAGRVHQHCSMTAQHVQTSSAPQHIASRQHGHRTGGTFVLDLSWSTPRPARTSCTAAVLAAACCCSKITDRWHLLEANSYCTWCADSAHRQPLAHLPTKLPSVESTGLG